MGHIEPVKEPAPATPVNDNSDVKETVHDNPKPAKQSSESKLTPVSPKEPVAAAVKVAPEVTPASPTAATSAEATPPPAPIADSVLEKTVTAPSATPVKARRVPPGGHTTALW